MLYQSKFTAEPGAAQAQPAPPSRWSRATDAAEPQTAILCAPRSLPSWAATLSAVFAIGAGLCLLAVGLLAVFFQALVAEQAQPVFALLLALVGLVPVLGALLFDFAHGRSLWGYRVLRGAQARRAQAGLALLVGVLLGVLHPLLALGVALSGLGGLAGGWLLSRRDRAEPLWDVTPAEAAGILAGRDAVGLAMATTAPDSHALEAPLARSLCWGGALVGLACASLLAAQGHLTTAAVPGVGLITLWASGALGGHLLARTRPESRAEGLTRSLDRLEAAEPDMTPGLHVAALSVMQPAGPSLLSEVSLDLEPGSILGVTGPSGAGKSLLLQALGAPYDLAGLDLRGAVRANGRDLWQRDAQTDMVPAVLLPPQPLILPAGGRDNLTCFHGGSAPQQGQHILESLIHSAEEAEVICAAPDATRLPLGRRKALALARGLLMAPDVYLFDRPEDGLSDPVIAALAERLLQEKRLGRCIVMVTGNRALLEICDRLLAMEEGRVVDYGDAREIRQKAVAGWLRYSGRRALSSEEGLTRWVRNQFQRTGDEPNRRAMSRVAAEMLALSCQSAPRLGEPRIRFELKKTRTHALLRMIDDDPGLSSGRIERARLEMEEAEEGMRLTPLAEVLRHVEDLQTTVERDKRVITAQVATFDPRRIQPGGGPL
ncbi:ATP-binding cassette domain-containing protein [Pseudoroseicyclus aestuarii]|uniref:ABC-type multidrug transport system ATPase subunit n=1 Tax=Pseudoroseicyclus aestuarii TaxID=1795041 RepID=A0A318SVX4_9RHOB|nr:ATP-binding cassette domain-containing protein [Pseudoroseicyclus aestuarii]PYE86000.1 ABC-type multidrug transport system ATPase subunit [Pseudoroseicyclus aestuarii]